MIYILIHIEDTKAGDLYVIKCRLKACSLLIKLFIKCRCCSLTATYIYDFTPFREYL